MTPIIQHKSQITRVSSRTHITAACVPFFLVVQMRLGNSSYSPTIAGLVLEHLCPAIQNILEDGLRDHKLDFIIGQRRNHSWSVVEISTRMVPVRAACGGPSCLEQLVFLAELRKGPTLTLKHKNEGNEK
uniref:RUN domain-containing protein n=1 Tax=Xiphophorus couchianus TaxID=32473 RepID=A0A3B5LA91_9TELE